MATNSPTPQETAPPCVECRCIGRGSHRAGKLADPDELKDALKKNSASQETLARMEEHLAKNGVDIKQTKLQ